MARLLIGLLTLLASAELQAQNADRLRARTPEEHGLAGPILAAHVSADGVVRLDGAVADSAATVRTIRSHIRMQPDGAVRFSTERGLPYETYILHLDTIKGAFAAEWDVVSLRDYGIPYGRLKPSARDTVRAEVPLRIVLAEPGDGQ